MITVHDLDITGADALDLYQGIGGGGLRLDKYNDPIEPAREGLTVSEAREIAAVDGGLVHLVAELEWLGSMIETVARCGPINVIVQSPDARRREPEIVIGDLSGLEPLRSMPDADIVEAAGAALRSHLLAAGGAP